MVKPKSAKLFTFEDNMKTIDTFFLNSTALVKPKLIDAPGWNHEEVRESHVNHMKKHHDSLTSNYVKSKQPLQPKKKISNLYPNRPKWQ